MGKAESDERARVVAFLRRWAASIAKTGAGNALKGAGASDTPAIAATVAAGVLLGAADHIENGQHLKAPPISPSRVNLSAKRKK